MERRRRTGGERGGRGMEENTMAILDTFGFSNSKISHHLDDDRASCFSGSSENLFFPIMEVHLREMCEAIFRILKDALDLIIESYQLLVKLDKRFPRVYLSKQEQADSSAPSKVIPQVIMVEEGWTVTMKREQRQIIPEVQLIPRVFMHLYMKSLKCLKGRNLKEMKPHS
ncbi:isoform X1 [Orobanche minor]